MKQLKHIILLTIFTLIVCSFQIENDNVSWSVKKLVWADFKGKADGGNGHSAYTDYSISVNLKSQRDSLVFTVNCVFNKSTSWVKYGLETDLLLRHEQTHFDIAEIYARELRKTYSSTKFTYKSIQEDFTKLQKENLNACKAEQKLYDTETNHSINKVKQLEWDKKVEKRLKELESFSQKVVKIPFKR